MEPNHLKSNEIIFELLCRGLQPQDNQMLRRAQLRQQLRKERNGPSVSFIQPYDDYEKNVSQIEESLTDLWDLLNSENVTSLVCTRVNTRLLHLENRINLLKPSGKEQISKKNDFNTQLLTLQGLLIEHSESQIENDLKTQPSESEIIDQILRNLNPYFSERVSLHDVDTLDRLKELCRKVQDVKSRIDKYHPPPQKRSVLLEPDLAYVGLRNSSDIVASVNNSDLNVKKCFNCGYPSHMHRQCPKPASIFCFGCGLLAPPGVSTTHNNNNIPFDGKINNFTENYQTLVKSMLMPELSTRPPQVFDFTKAKYYTQGIIMGHLLHKKFKIQNIETY
ncbi:hypothetical protein RN001_010084 [Aquatica leii]|uniref:CCHC-type domain-containing protein n=1 Tax=Aquatica leii TaxID=1421715 RepID=A0AAN7QH83_9COLE|nr:hypothetical protein RN001_010084 [Aquatica leii]